MQSVQLYVVLATGLHFASPNTLSAHTMLHSDAKNETVHCVVSIIEYTVPALKLNVGTNYEGQKLYI